MRCWVFVKLICLLVLLLTLLCPASGFAAAARTSMLSLRNIRTDLGLQYIYDGRDHKPQTGKSSYRYSNYFEETLTVGMNYSIYKPKYSSGSLRVKFVYDQEWSDGTGQSSKSARTSRFEYSVDSTILRDSYAPMRVSAESVSRRFNRDYSGDYDQDSENYNFSLNVRHRSFPSSLAYDHFEIRTDGLSVDRESTVDRLSLRVTNSFKNLARTSMGFSASTDWNSTVGSADEFETDTFEYNIVNNLYPLVDRNKLHLRSYYRLRDETGNRESREYTWEEELEWIPGRALTGLLYYEQSLQRAFDQETLRKVGKARLSHQLFLSLDTDIEIRGRRKEFTNGQEDDVGGTLGLSYTKRLSLDSTYAFRLVQGYGITDRDLDDNSIFVIDERLLVDPVSPNLLANEYVVEGSIVVRDALRTLIYIEGIDYLVFGVGNSTELVIPPGSAISFGDIISVDYEYMVNPSVEYSTLLTSLYSSMTFLRQRLTVFGRFINTTHDLRSGSDDLLTLSDSRIYSLGSYGSFDPITFAVNFTDSDTPPDRYFATDGFVTYSQKKGPRTLSLTIRDAYRNYRNGKTGHTNAFSTRVDYRRLYKQFINTTTSATYRNTSGQDRDRENLELMFLMSIRFGRTLFTADVNEEWLYYNDTEQRDDRVELNVTRSF